MKSRTPDARALDLQALAKAGGSLQGSWPVGGMQRLTAGLNGPASDADVAWSVHASRCPAPGGAAQTWLHLRAHVQVLLECQRCLQTMSEVLAVDRRLRFVPGEDEAARLDEESDDDVLELPARLDVHALIEDELILALPLVPRHDRCPQQLPAAAVPDAGDSRVREAAVEPPGESVDGSRPNPFAALAALRGRFGRGGG